ncbi:MAG: internal scaffolding protein [Arizlama microvirus]|nr:MAG: internal scaffolding protein [Arizlama microvirus]
MKMKKHPNHIKGCTDNNDPTLTDQSQAHTTDINIIVTQFLKTGQAPQGANPIYADFTHLPDDLRGFIEMGRSINTLHSSLPAALRDIPATELFRMTNEEITAKLTPPDKPAEKQKDEQK